MKTPAARKFVSFGDFSAGGDDFFLACSQIICIKNNQRRAIDRFLSPANAAIKARAFKADIVRTPVLKRPSKSGCVKRLCETEVLGGEFDIVDVIVCLRHEGLLTFWFVRLTASGDGETQNGAEMFFHAVSLALAQKRRPDPREKENGAPRLKPEGAVFTSLIPSKRGA